METLPIDAEMNNVSLIIQQEVHSGVWAEQPTGVAFRLRYALCATKLEIFAD